MGSVLMTLWVVRDERRPKRRAYPFKPADKNGQRLALFRLASALIAGDSYTFRAAPWRRDIREDSAATRRLQWAAAANFTESSKPL